jgi:hypothetical protein
MKKRTEKVPVRPYDPVMLGTVQAFQAMQFITFRESSRKPLSFLLPERRGLALL